MTNVTGIQVFTSLLLLCLSIGAAAQETCEMGISPERRGYALLQTQTHQSQRVILQKSVGEAQKGSLASKSASVLSPQRSAARELLSSELLQLGIQLLGSEELLDEVVSNSRFENVTYAGIPMLLRMVNGDLGNYTLWDEGTKDKLYGLDSLDTLLSKASEDPINMVDLGGNYGAVSIAAYKKYPTKLRAVTVEPIPSTYFFMRWNMALNEVPVIEEADLKKGQKAGLVPLNRAVVSNKRDGIDVCYTPPYTMMAQVCSCQDPTWPGKQCRQVSGVTTKGLFELFGEEPVTILKIDCEGCEFSSFPALMEIVKEDPSRVRRLVGELHFPTPEIEKMACQFDAGQFFVRICRTDENPVQPMPLMCGGEPTACDTDSNTAAIMDGIKKALHS